MKNTLYRTKIGLAFVTASLLTMVSCTGDFEHFNTDPNSANRPDYIDHLHGAGCNVSHYG